MPELIMTQYRVVQKNIGLLLMALTEILNHETRMIFQIKNPSPLHGIYLGPSLVGPTVYACRLIGTIEL